MDMFHCRIYHYYDYHENRIGNRNNDNECHNRFNAITQNTNHTNHTNHINHINHTNHTNHTNHNHNNKNTNENVPNTQFVYDEMDWGEEFETLELLEISKFSSVKEEILNNSYCKKTNEEWDHMEILCQDLYRSYINQNRVINDSHGDKRGTPNPLTIVGANGNKIVIQMMASFVLNCRKSYFKGQQERRLQFIHSISLFNNIFKYHWCELTEFDVVYHGLSCPLLLSESSGYRALTSTSRNISVAQGFASNYGIILSFKTNYSNLDISWISAFPNEEEVLYDYLSTLDMQQQCMMNYHTDYKIAQYQNSFEILIKYYNYRYYETDVDLSSGKWNKLLLNGEEEKEMINILSNQLTINKSISTIQITIIIISYN